MARAPADARKPHPPVEPGGIDVGLDVRPVEPFGGAHEGEAGHRKLGGAAVDPQRELRDVERQPVEPQIVLEADRLVQLIPHAGQRMFLQVAPHAGQVRRHFDAQLAQLVRRAYP